MLLLAFIFSILELLLKLYVLHVPNHWSRPNSNAQIILSGKLSSIWPRIRANYNKWCPSLTFSIVYSYRSFRFMKGKQILSILFTSLGLCVGGREVARPSCQVAARPIVRGQAPKAVVRSTKQTQLPQGSRWVVILRTVSKTKDHHRHNLARNRGPSFHCWSLVDAPNHCPSCRTYRSLGICHGEHGWSTPPATPSSNVWIDSGWQAVNTE